MSRTAAISIVQSASITRLCALVGLSLAYVPGANHDDALLLAMGGAAIGVVASLVSLLFKPAASDFSEKASPTVILGVRLSLGGFGLAVVGWLVGVFLSASFAIYIVAPGVVVGALGVVLINVGKRQQRGKAA